MIFETECDDWIWNRSLSIGSYSSREVCSDMASSIFTDECILEPIVIGDYGTFDIFQYRQGKFNELCLGANVETQDATGLRVYAGAHVLAHFFASPVGSMLLKGQRIVEIGCGTGVVGCLAAVSSEIRSLTLTDGDFRACALAERNLDHLVRSNKPLLPVLCKQLYWGGTFSEQNVVEHDIVIGCELMYYKTNVKDLLSTVLSLVSHGLFIHAHIFRKEEQDKEMCNFFAQAGWGTLMVPVPSFVPYNEISLRPDWLNVCCLVSGPVERIDKLAKVHQEWQVFLGCEIAQDENVRYADVQENCNFRTPGNFIVQSERE
jgi:hypothetical protein